MKVAIVDPQREEHYNTLFDYLEKEGLLTGIGMYQESRNSSEFDIVLTSDEWNCKSSTLITEAKRNGIPTLHIADGIVKWGNVWENPRSQDQDTGMPLFQPILSDRIACLGSFQARLFSSWGQHEKIALTGLPRFDNYVKFFHSHESTSQLRASRFKNQVPNILVIVANKPGYTDEHVKLAGQALADLNSFFINYSNDHPIHVTWRHGPRSPHILPTDIYGHIDKSGQPLLEALKFADVVVASPSTAVLEAMSMNIPTCIIDYLNSPEFLQAAWMIRSKFAIKDEMQSLLRAEERRLLFQRYLLHDQMRMDGPASPRVAKLMQQLISTSKISRENNCRPCYSGITIDSPDYRHLYPYFYSSDLLFPAHPLFARNDVDLINCEVGQLRLFLKELQPPPEERRKLQIKTRIFSSVRKILSFYKNWTLR